MTKKQNKKTGRFGFKYIEYVKTSASLAGVIEEPIYYKDL